MYRRIMVPLDGSASGERALPLAVSLARQTGGWLQLACCAPAGAQPDGTATAAQALEARAARAYLRSVADWIALQGIEVTTAVPAKPPVEGLYERHAPARSIPSGGC